MSLRERLFVHAQVRNGFGLSSRQSALHGPVLAGMNFVPTQMQLIGYRLLAGGLHPVDGQSFKHRSETARRFRPRQLHAAASVYRAVAPGRGRGTSVQVPPAALRLVIVKRTTLPAFRAEPLKARITREMHMNFAFAQFQIGALHTPRFSHSQNLGIQLLVLHLIIIRTCPLKCRNAQKPDTGSARNARNLPRLEFDGFGPLPRPAPDRHRCSRHRHAFHRLRPLAYVRR